MTQIFMRTDVRGIEENMYWGAERLIRIINDKFGYLKEETTLGHELLEKDLDKFLEGARLSKYKDAAMAWCDSQGADSIEDVAENVDQFISALNLKPLEVKRAEKAAASVVAR